MHSSTSVTSPAAVSRPRYSPSQSRSLLQDVAAVAASELLATLVAISTYTPLQFHLHDHLPSTYRVSTSQADPPAFPVCLVDVEQTYKALAVPTETYPYLTDLLCNTLLTSQNIVSFRRHHALYVPALFSSATGTCTPCSKQPSSVSSHSCQAFHRQHQAWYSSETYPHPWRSSHRYAEYLSPFRALLLAPPRLP